MNTQVIITQKAGQSIPKDFMAEALKKFPSCYGIAIVDNDGDKPNMDISVAAQPISLDKMMETILACDKLPMMIVLGNMTQDFHKEDDPQPYAFQQASENGEPDNILAWAFEGDIPKYSQPGKGHTDEFNLWENFICPTVMEKHTAAADVDDFFNRLKSSQFEQLVDNAIGHRGVACMLTIGGEFIAFGKNELGLEKDWGTASNHCGYDQTSVISKAKDAVTAGAGKAKSRLASALGNAASAVAGTGIKTDANGIHEVPPKNTSVKAPQDDDKNFTVIDIPKKLQGNARNAYIRLFLGLSATDNMPVGHQSDSFKLRVPNDLVQFALQDVSTKESVVKLRDRVKKFQETGVVSTPEQVASAVNADKPEIKTDNKAADFLPVLDADTKKGSVDLVTDWATRPSDKHPTALEIQKIESKWPRFTVMCGIKLSDMQTWTIHDVKQLSKKYPDAMALAFIEMRAVATAAGGFEIQEKNPAEKQVEVPSEKPEVAPAKPAAAGGKKSRLSTVTGKAA